MKRLFKFVVKRHKKTCFAILLLIIVSSIASVMGTIFIKSLIDDYITQTIKTLIIVIGIDITIIETRTQTIVVAETIT